MKVEFSFSRTFNNTSSVVLEFICIKIVEKDRGCASAYKMITGDNSCGHFFRYTYCVYGTPKIL